MFNKTITLLFSLLSGCGGGSTDSRDVPDQHFDLRLSEQSPFKNQVLAIGIR